MANQKDGRIEGFERDFGEIELMNLEKIRLRCLECGDCLLWQGPTGQGVPKLRSSSARRFVYEQTYGPVPKNLVISVKCGNNLCLNPEHLKKNTRSAVGAEIAQRPSVALRRRVSCAITNRKKFAIINEEIAAYIRSSDKMGIELAKELNVSTSLISRVRVRKSWVETKNPWVGLL